MHPELSLDTSLRDFNTFGIDARASHYLRVTSIDALRAALADPVLAALPRLVLGGGSNIVLTGDFKGLVLHMAIMGKQVLADSPLGTALVRAGAGESWHGLVDYTIAQGLGGLENLALIPGTVGASPIQNIGAYGVEIKDVFHSVTVLDGETVRTMTAKECRFAYRDSIFKQPDGAGLIVLDVTYALPRAWQPVLGYAELANAVREAGLDAPTPRQIADLVIAIRRRKLPDPAVIGNAGSFFKNPVVSAARCAAILAVHPTLVHHAQADGSVKLAAGWLIDQCGWKGRSMGAAGVYPKQALVLVNQGGATGADVVALARAIAADVMARFGVALETEPVFV